MQRKLVVTTQEPKLGNMSELMATFIEVLSKSEVVQTKVVVVDVEPEYKFTVDEWEKIETWTGEDEDYQASLLSCGAESVTPAIAVAIIAEMVSERAMEDATVKSAVRKLAQIAAQLPD